MKTPPNLGVMFFHGEACRALEKLSKIPNPGAKLTLLVRRPEAPDGSQDMVVTDDDLNEAIRALEIRRDAEKASHE
jgi:hypothetical protein